MERPPTGLPKPDKVPEAVKPPPTGSPKPDQNLFGAVKNSREEHLEAPAGEAEPQPFVKAGLPLNSVVRILDLQKRPELNGQLGTVVGWDTVEDRCQVRLGDGSGLLLKEPGHTMSECLKSVTGLPQGIACNMEPVPKDVWRRTWERAQASSEQLVFWTMAPAQPRMTEKSKKCHEEVAMFLTWLETHHQEFEWKIKLHRKAPRFNQDKAEEYPASCLSSRASPSESPLGPSASSRAMSPVRSMRSQVRGYESLFQNASIMENLQLKDIQDGHPKVAVPVFETSASRPRCDIVKVQCIEIELCMAEHFDGKYGSELRRCRWPGGVALCCCNSAKVTGIAEPGPTAISDTGMAQRRATFWSNCITQGWA
eukprot:s569_g34.t1